MFTMESRCFPHSPHSLPDDNPPYSCVLVMRKGEREKQFLLPEVHYSVGGWQQVNPEKYTFCGSKSCEETET